MGILMVPFYFAINHWIAVILCVIAYMAIGTVWYGALFGKTWRKMTGMDKLTKEQTKKTMINGMITGAVCAAIQASILGMCLSIIRLTPIANAFSLVVILWFGFSCTGLATNYAYTRKPVKLFLIDSVYHLVTWTAMMLILVQWLR